jgi:hypothetical protein
MTCSAPCRTASPPGYFLAILRRPLLYGMVIGDVQMWGKLTGSEPGHGDDRHDTVLASYLDVLAARGLVRTDLAPPGLTYAFQSVFEGFIYAEGTVSSAGTRDQRARLLSATVESAFSPAGHGRCRARRRGGRAAVPPSLRLTSPVTGGNPVAGRRSPWLT